MSRIHKTLLEDFRKSGFDYDDPFGKGPEVIAAIVLFIGCVLSLIVGGGLRLLIGWIFQVMP